MAKQLSLYMHALEENLTYMHKTVYIIKFLSALYTLFFSLKKNSIINKPTSQTGWK